MIAVKPTVKTRVCTKYWLSQPGPRMIPNKVAKKIEFLKNRPPQRRRANQPLTHIQQVCHVLDTERTSAIQPILCDNQGPSRILQYFLPGSQAWREDHYKIKAACRFPDRVQFNVISLIQWPNPGSRGQDTLLLKSESGCHKLPFPENTHIAGDVTHQPILRASFTFP